MAHRPSTIGGPVIQPDSGPGVRVQVQVMPDPADLGMNMVGFTVKTGQAILGGAEVTLGVRAPAR